MQTSHNQHSAPASSLNREVKELGRRSTPHSPAATTALLLPTSMHTEPVVGVVRHGQGEHSCTEGSIKAQLVLELRETI